MLLLDLCSEQSTSTPNALLTTTWFTSQFLKFIYFNSWKASPHLNTLVKLQTYSLDSINTLYLPIVVSHRLKLNLNLWNHVAPFLVWHILNLKPPSLWSLNRLFNRSPWSLKRHARTDTHKRHVHTNTECLKVNKLWNQIMAAYCKSAP